MVASRWDGWSASRGARAGGVTVGSVGGGRRFRSSMTTSVRIAVLTAVLAVALPSYSAPGEMHVALLGDSLAFGAGDETGKGIGGRLEPELRSRGVKSI